MLKLFNTLSGKIESFQSLEKGQVKLYTCGPTVYNYGHIGNSRAYVFEDLLKRLLLFLGFKVTHVMNITDVGHFRENEGGDKMAHEADALGESPWEVAERVTTWFLEDMDRLRMKRPHHLPRATDYIPSMVELVERLLKSGHAYEVEEQVYFSVSAFKEYGVLSGNKVEDLIAGARVEVDERKRHPADFALWKTDPHHVMKWETTLGKDGFPGWHLECSAMALSLLGETLDIHTGGEDLVFPHHECEIAQSEAATGKLYCRHWLHNRFLMVDGGKMGKSLGNAYTPEDVIRKGYTSRELRFALLRGHYRQPLNFTWEGMEDARGFLSRLDRFQEEIVRLAETEDKGRGIVFPIRTAFIEALENDLDVPAALTVLMDGIRTWRATSLGGEGAREVLSFLGEVDDVLGIGPELQEEDREIDRLVSKRERARKRGDWTEADRIREILKSQGIEVEDTPHGPQWRSDSGGGSPR